MLLRCLYEKIALCCESDIVDAEFYASISDYPGHQSFF